MENVLLGLRGLLVVICGRLPLLLLLLLLLPERTNNDRGNRIGQTTVGR